MPCLTEIPGETDFGRWSRYRRYATTFRYSLTPTPKIDDMQKVLKALLGLHEVARAELLDSAS